MLAHDLTHLLEIVQHRRDHVGDSFGSEENQPGPLRTMLESDQKDEQMRLADLRSEGVPN